MIGPLKVPSEVGLFLEKLTQYPDYFLPHVGRSYPLYSLPQIFENLFGLKKKKKKNTEKKKENVDFI